MYFREKEEPPEPKQPGPSKKVIIVSVVAGIGTLVAVWLIWSAIFSGQFATYHEKTYNISIKYPKDWQVAPGYAGSVVTFVSPKEDALDTFQENVNVAVTDLSKKPMTLDEYTQLAIKQTTTVFKDVVKVTESKPITFAGQPAYKFEFHTPKENEGILTFIWFIKDNQAYTITTFGQLLRYEKYRPLFDEMLRSFSIPL